MLSNFDFPEDLLFDILLRLPAKTLARFKLVSKSWHDLIHSRSFVKAHLNRLESCDSGSRIVFGYEDGHRIRKLSTFDYNKLPVPKELHYPLLKCEKQESTTDVELLGSSNGVLCLLYADRKIVLWNPLISQHYLEISHPQNLSNCLCGYGFGYEKASDDYKVVVLILRPEGSEVWTYSLKLKGWKRVENCSHDIWYWPLLSGVPVSGTLHWITYDRDYLVGFNLADEKFHMLPLPNHSSPTCRLSIGILGGCLALTCKTYVTSYHIFVMKDYGVKDSWTLISNIEGTQLAVGWLHFIRPLAYGKSNKQVIIENNFSGILFVYDLEKQTVGEEFSYRNPSFEGNRLKSYAYFETLECFETDGKSSKRNILRDDRKSQCHRKIRIKL